jgi:hypothetical protein
MMLKYDSNIDSYSKVLQKLCKCRQNCSLNLFETFHLANSKRLKVQKEFINLGDELEVSAIGGEGPAGGGAGMRCGNPAGRAAMGRQRSRKPCW